MSKYRHCDKCEQLKHTTNFDFSVSVSECIQCRGNKILGIDYAKQLRGGMVSNKKKELSDQLRRNQTESELLFGLIIKQWKLKLQFRKQVPLLGFILDFYAQGIKLCIEIDGGYHQVTKEYDERRDLILKDYGIRTIRITNDELFNNTKSVKSFLRSEIWKRTMSRKDWKKKFIYKDRRMIKNNVKR